MASSWMCRGKGFSKDYNNLYIPTDDSNILYFINIYSVKLKLPKKKVLSIFFLWGRRSLFKRREHMRSVELSQSAESSPQDYSRARSGREGGGSIWEAKHGEITSLAESCSFLLHPIPQSWTRKTV